MRFRGNGRKVARRRCADRETVISFRSVLAPLGPGQNRVGDTHSLVLSCLARRHRLAKKTTTTLRRQGQSAALPTLVSQRTAAAPFIRIPTSPFAFLCYIICCGSRKHAAGDVRPTSHEHLAVSQHCGIDLCALSHASHIWLDTLRGNI